MNELEWMMFFVIVVMALAGSYVTNENRRLQAQIMRLRYGNAAAQDTEQR